MSVNGHLDSFVILVNPKKGRSEEPFLFFISDLKDAKAIANHYLKRWKIECCFRHLKTNGFNIEDINLKDDNKIQLMMGVLACTYLLAIMEGIIQQAREPLKMKSYKNGKSYPSISVFRRGFIVLQKTFLTIENAIAYFNDPLKQVLIRVVANNLKSV
jgi:transposase